MSAASMLAIDPGTGKPWTKAEVLQKLGITGNITGIPVLEQRSLNAAAAQKGLPEPFASSAGGALAQDLIAPAAIAVPGVAADAGAAATARAALRLARGASSASGALKDLTAAGALAAFASDPAKVSLWVALVVVGLGLMLTGARSLARPKEKPGHA